MKSAVLLLAALVLSAIPALGQPYFFDDCEAYGPGSQLAPQFQPPPSNGGWTGFANTPALAAFVRDAATVPGLSAAHSGTQVLEIMAGTDAVQPFSLNAGSGIPYANYSPSPPSSHPTTCVWRLSAQMYVPSPGVGWIYAVPFNQYNLGAPVGVIDWFIVNAGAGWFDVTGGLPGGPRPLPFDQWFEFAYVIDLDQHTFSFEFDGTPLASGPLVIPFELAALNLFSGSGGTAYVDDVRVERISIDEYQLNQPQAGLDLNGVLGTVCAPARLELVTGSGATLNLASTLSNAYDVGVAVAPLVPATGAGQTTLGGQIVNLDLTTPLQFLNGLTFQNTFPVPGISLPFSVPMPVVASAQMIVGNPASPDLFSLSQGVELEALVCATSQGFEGLALGLGSYPPGWTDGPGAADQWWAWTGNLGQVGPTGAHTGTHYLYTETDILPQPAGPFILETCAMDTSNANGVFSFALSRRSTSPAGQAFGTVTLKQDDGSGTFPVTLMTWTGVDPTGQSWSVYNVPFVPSPGGTDRFQIAHVGPTSWPARVAIDSIDVQ